MASSVEYFQRDRVSEWETGAGRPREVPYRPEIETADLYYDKPLAHHGPDRDRRSLPLDNTMQQHQSQTNNRDLYSPRMRQSCDRLDDTDTVGMRYRSFTHEADAERPDVGSSFSQIKIGTRNILDKIVAMVKDQEARQRSIEDRVESLAAAVTSLSRDNEALSSGQTTFNNRSIYTQQSPVKIGDQKIRRELNRNTPYRFETGNRVNSIRSFPSWRSKSGYEPSTRRCFNCLSSFHTVKDCVARRKPNRKNFAATRINHSAAGRNSRTFGGRTNNHIAAFRENAGDATSLYAETLINNHHLLCAVASGFGNNILPAQYAGGLEIRRCNEILYTANRTQINVLGECFITVRFGNKFETKIKFLVSDNIKEATLGLNFLEKCKIDFGKSVLHWGRFRVNLVERNRSYVRQIQTNEPFTTAFMDSKMSVENSAGWQYTDRRDRSSDNKQIGPGEASEAVDLNSGSVGSEALSGLFGSSAGEVTIGKPSEKGGIPTPRLKQAPSIYSEVGGGAGDDPPSDISFERDLREGSAIKSRRRRHRQMAVRNRPVYRRHSVDLRIQTSSESEFWNLKRPVGPFKYCKFTGDDEVRGGQGRNFGWKEDIYLPNLT